MPLTVLFVCTGNICRSPTAQLLLNAWADPAAAVVATSAGTDALVGRAIDAGAAQALRERGIDPAGHIARQFDPAMAYSADLILTAERAHRDGVLTEVPRALRRTFTMKEFARITAQMSPVSPERALAQVAARRGAGGEVPLSRDDIADPVGLSVAEVRPVVEEIAEAIRALVTILDIGARPAMTQRRSAPQRPAPRPAVRSRPRPVPHPRPRPS